MRIPETTAPELRERLALAGETGLVLLDVREPNEWSHCRLPGAVLAPLSQLASLGVTALPAGLTRETPIVVYCHHGVRSAQVTAWLLRQGFEQVVSLAGGIEAWSMQVDPAVPRYN
jgi:rhodanese-related sulfurtransferase